MEVIIDGKTYVEKDSGDSNSGNWNSGDSNSGYRNSGNCNSGDRNSGDWNSGDWNSGDRNSGDWNSGDWNSGYCNSETPKVILFNKITDFDFKDVGTKLVFPDYFYFDLTKWVEVKDMTDEEKAKYPKYEVTTGFLRVFDYKTAWKNSFDKATKEDIANTLKLPNFDYNVFEKLSGISKKDFDKRLLK